jgi:hypothetical protein
VCSSDLFSLLLLFLLFFSSSYFFSSDLVPRREKVAYHTPLKGL